MIRHGGWLNVPYAGRTCLRGADCTARTAAAKRARKIKAGKAAVKTDGFAAYEAAAREAKKAGKWLFQRDCTNVAAFLEYGGMGVMNAVQLLDWLQQQAE